MKRSLAVLCLLGALRANAQNDTCQDPLPDECLGVCEYLRFATTAGPPPTVVAWLLDTGNTNDCTRDAACYLNDAAACHRVGLRIDAYVSAPNCFHFLARCLTSVALFLMTNPAEAWPAWGAP